jgi:hypothetical protein
MSNKEINVVYLKPSELSFGLKNPRKITKKSLEELKLSLTTYGDFSVVVVDENNNIISGHQRVKALRTLNIDEPILCKQLKGYSDIDLRVINIKANQHSGIFDVDMLADFVKDLHIDIGKDFDISPKEATTVTDMELTAFEKYDYVLVVCKTSLDYERLCETFELNQKISAHSATKKSPLKARAVWYHDISHRIK